MRDIKLENTHVEIKNACVTYQLPRFFLKGIRKQIQVKHNEMLANSLSKDKKPNQKSEIKNRGNKVQMHQINSKSTGKPVVEALNDINISIKYGEKIGIAGDNGAGKTTLLRLIAGLIEPTQGIVSTYGSVHSIINMSGGIDPIASGEENLRRLAVLLRVPRDQRPAFLESAIEFAELDTFLYAPVRVYSPGMKFRLLFAAMTSTRPDILVLDEWLGVTDARFQSRASERMSAMVKSTSILILASNNSNALIRHCDRIIVLESGKITHDFSTPEYEAYLKDN